MQVPIPSALPSSQPIKTDMVVLGCATAAAGVLQVLFAQVDGLLLPSFVFSTAVGLLALYLTVALPRRFSVQALLAAGFCLAYGAGALNTFIQTWGQPGDFLDLAEASSKAINVAHGYVLLVSGLLLLSEGVAPSIDLPAPGFDADLPKTTLLLSAFVILFALLMLATGRLGFQGNVTGDENTVRISALGSLAGQALVPFGALAMYAAITTRGALRLSLLVCAAAMLVLMATQGRRIFMYGMVVYVLGYVSAGGTFAIRKPSTWAAIAIALPVLYAAFRFFYALRMANWEIGGYANFFDLVGHAFEIFTGARGGDLDDALSENTKTRTFILDYLAVLFEKSERYGGLGGLLAGRAIGVSVPSMLYRGKDKLLELGSEENITHPHFGMIEWDAPNSLLTAGIGDFATIGGLVYPLLAALVLWLLLWALRRWAPPKTFLIVTFAVANLLLNTEAEMASYFASLRNVFILVFLVFAYDWLKAQFVDDRLLPALRGAAVKPKT